MWDDDVAGSFSNAQFVYEWIFIEAFLRSPPFTTEDSITDEPINYHLYPSTLWHILFDNSRTSYKKQLESNRKARLSLKIKERMKINSVSAWKSSSSSACNFQQQFTCSCAHHRLLPCCFFLDLHTFSLPPKNSFFTIRSWGVVSHHVRTSPFSFCVNSAFQCSLFIHRKMVFHFLHGDFPQSNTFCMTHYQSLRYSRHQTQLIFNLLNTN